MNVTLEEWKLMSGTEQTVWLFLNFPVGEASLARRKFVRGVGINDAQYCTQPRIDGVQVKCPAYISWQSMMQRCYDKKYHLKSPTYSGVDVCLEWRSFMAFRSWWVVHNVDGWHLDKDILFDDGIYSPESCLFVPPWLNAFAVDNSALRGECPVGVNFHKFKGLFVARCRNPISCSREHLGYFSNPDAAHKAWLTRKLELAAVLKPQMDEVDFRVYHRIVEIVSNAI